MSARARFRFASGALGLAAVLLGVAAGSVLTASAAGPAEPRAPLEIVAKRSVFTLPQTPAVGLDFVGGGDLFDAAGSTRLGEGYSHCTIVKLGTEVPPVITAHCTSTFELSDGQIHLSSLRNYTIADNGFKDTTMAIVGGTGSYATARGGAKTTRETGTDVAYRFTLDVVVDS